MSNRSFCSECKRELTGAIELKFSDVGKHTYLVTRETADCNWRRCKGCNLVLCKKCDDSRPEYCCEEGRIVARERAAAAIATPNLTLVQ